MKPIDECFYADTLQIKVVEDAIILPNRDECGGVVDNQSHCVQESLFQYSGLTLWGGMYNTDEAIEEIAETVVFIGQIRGQWGNFLFDCMARMWYVLKEQCPYRLAYCGVQMEENALRDPNTRYGEFMQILGIDKDRFIDIRKPTGFSKIIIPELSVFPGTYYTEEFKIVFNRAIENVNRLMSYQSYDKIYLTRRQMSACKELGEQEIERAFRRMGYQVIAPEQLPVAEQIYVFNHCKSFASIEGTTSHNILFARDGIEHIILRKQNYINTRQIIYDKIKNIVPEYIDVFYEPYRGFPLSHDAGPFYIGVTASLDKWMRKQGNAFSVWDRCKVMCAGIWNGIVYTLKCIYYKYWLYR